MVWNFFDLQNLFVNEISGSWMIFIALSCIIIFYFCAQFRMPNAITMIVMVLWLLLLSAFNSSLLVLATIIVAVYVGWQVIKFISRQ